MTSSAQGGEAEKRTAWLNFPLEQIHETWWTSWGMSIKSDHIRHAIEATPRFATRLKKEMVEAAGRVIYDSVASGNGVNIDRALYRSQLDLIPKFLDLAGPKLIQQTGLVWHANTIKLQLNGAKGQEILKNMGKEAIRYALLFKDIASPSHVQEPHKLPDLIMVDGLASLIIWLRQFPKNMACHLALRLPLPSDEIKNRIAENIMIPAAREVVNEVLSSEAQL